MSNLIDSSFTVVVKVKKILNANLIVAAMILYVLEVCIFDASIAQSFNTISMFKFINKYFK